MTHPLTYLLLFGTALLAGAINSVAGGGTLLTYPALFWAGVPAVDANATSTVALVPGSLSAVWGYRGEMAGSRRDLLWMAVPSLIGGFLGARYAEVVGNALFARLVPWLILSATALFMAQEPVRAARRCRAAGRAPADKAAAKAEADARRAASSGRRCFSSWSRCTAASSARASGS